MIINQQFLLVLVTTFFIGSVAGYLGTLMFTKRMTLVAGPLGHLTLPGIALALVLGFDTFLGALLFVFLGIIFIWFFGKKTKIPMEALVAIIFPFSMSAAFLILPGKETVEALIGNIQEITLATSAVAILISIVVFVVVKLIYKKIVFIGVSQDIAKTEGLQIHKLNFIYLVCIAFIVALSTKVVGGLMTVAIMAIPAATSKMLGKNLSQYAYLGAIIGATASVIGVVAFKFANIPVGPAIIIANTVIFLTSVLIKKI